MNRKLKMRLMLPVIIVPFLTVIFRILGGGRSDMQMNDASMHQGLLLDLPNAKLKDDADIDKLAYYNQADADSLKLKDEIKKDPYYLGMTEGEDPNVKMVNEKLAALQEAMEDNDEVADKRHVSPARSVSPVIAAGQVERLERLLERPVNQEPEPDPEMDQLNGLLDRVIAVQHPERMSDRREMKTYEPENYQMVSGKAISDTLNPGFFSLQGMADTPQVFSSFPAVIRGTQILVNGSVVRLCLMQNVFIGNELIPSGTQLYGIAALQGERLQFQISSIRCGNKLVPVKLEAYDMDGLTGIYIPGAIGRATMKQQLNNPLPSTGIISADPSLAAQAATMGVETVKGLFSKKIKLVRCTVRDGYLLLLHNKVSK